ncbi:MAG: hypothetical protein C4532_12195 [Candidatus Abyssobacteria bacterium SURF_17]|jgi:polyferredoxin|uniref:SxtJ n=1 Tax=Candidatus Abyssobacteria bacterium SURF_17 TaxID=2093361 RepID=A0A419EW71_9BACT|nr:MAG: hypothetical protein C4532_12195 [Candidatus Abyssubacteria bacterium SURF_17]
MSREQAKDTGMALTLICLLLAYYLRNERFMALSAVLLVADMVWPKIFLYPARVWFGAAHLIGAVVSRVVLTVLFCALVTPVGFVRRMMGADPMQQKKWKKGTASVFKTRDHTYIPEDIETPY